jgi:hypothetical protein
MSWLGITGTIFEVLLSVWFLLLAYRVVGKTAMQGLGTLTRTEFPRAVGRRLFLRRRGVAGGVQEPPLSGN